MGRPKKTTIIQTLAKEAVEQQKRGKTKVKFRPMTLFEVLITHSDYTYESRLFDEKGLEYVVKKGGE